MFFSFLQGDQKEGGKKNQDNNNSNKKKRKKEILKWYHQVGPAEFSYPGPEGSKEVASYPYKREVSYAWV